MRGGLLRSFGTAVLPLGFSIGFSLGCSMASLDFLFP